ncbi:MAG TPA: hypothetical protein VMM60_01030 [Ilumatobacter sp.]|nr:hypothetical protein [Ilumatobacter sp.]
MTLDSPVGPTVTTDLPCTVALVSEFLPKPRWRERWSPKQLGVAIAVTFTSILLFGAGLLWLFIIALDWLDAPGWVIVATWAVLTSGSTLWALVAKIPATTSDMEYQPWTEYVVRYVMVGNESVRPAPLRLITGVIFGAPIGCYLITFGVAVLTGAV